VVEVPLSPELEKIVVPVVRNAAAAGRHVLLAAVPRSSGWFLQMMEISALTGTRVRPLLNADADKEVTTPPIADQGGGRMNL
jgi:hypothetical protein